MLTCRYCLDYEDCPYHEPSDYTPYKEDDTVGCPFDYAVEEDSE